MFHDFAFWCNCKLQTRFAVVLRCCPSTVPTAKSTRKHFVKTLRLLWLLHCLFSGTKQTPWQSTQVLSLRVSGAFFTEMRVTPWVPFPAGSRLLAWRWTVWPEEVRDFPTQTSGALLHNCSQLPRHHTTHFHKTELAERGMCQWIFLSYNNLTPAGFIIL